MGNLPVVIISRGFSEIVLCAIQLITHLFKYYSILLIIVAFNKPMLFSIRTNSFYFIYSFSCYKTLTLCSFFGSLIKIFDDLFKAVFRRNSLSTEL